MAKATFPNYYDYDYYGSRLSFADVYEMAAALKLDPHGITDLPYQQANELIQYVPYERPARRPRGDDRPSLLARRRDGAPRVACAHGAGLPPLSGAIPVGQPGRPLLPGLPAGGTAGVAAPV